MPSFTEDPLSWRKRKRENEEPLSRPTTFIPCRVDSSRDPYLQKHTPHIHESHHNHNHNHTINSGFDTRPRCLPRKRRHVQVQQYHHQHQHQHPTLLSPNIYATPQDPYSPPVSPKTLVPLQHPAPTSAPPSLSASALRPCHICHRRPTTRQVLDAYADCDLCSNRACFICLRLCDSPSCPGARSSSSSNSTTPTQDLQFPSTDPYASLECRRKICSSCAVEGISETGVEIVRCLDCVRPGWDSWALDHEMRD